MAIRVTQVHAEVATTQSSIEARVRHEYIDVLVSEEGPPAAIPPVSATVEITVGPPVLGASIPPLSIASTVIVTGGANTYCDGEITLTEEVCGGEMTLTEGKVVVE